MKSSWSWSVIEEVSRTNLYHEHSNTSSLLGITDLCESLIYVINIFDYHRTVEFYTLR